MNEHSYTYTDKEGHLVTVPCLDWLEDGSYWKCDESVDADDYEIGEYLPCSRYYIGEAYGDSQSIWLNDEMVEAQV
jgi:hypothetical protein